MKLMLLRKVSFAVLIVVMIFAALIYSGVIKINKSPVDKLPHFLPDSFDNSINLTNIQTKVQKGAIEQAVMAIQKSYDFKKEIKGLEAQIPYEIWGSVYLERENYYYFLNQYLNQLKRLPIPEGVTLCVADHFKVTSDGWIYIDYRAPWSEIEKFLLGE